MSIAERTRGLAPPAVKQLGSIADQWGLLLAVAVLAAILLLPTPAGLPEAGHRMLAIFGFAVVVVWITEVAYGTDTFMARDFVRTGLVITVLAYVLTLALGATYWRWLGYV